MNKFLGIFLLFLFMSCTSDLDFDQSNDFKLNPSFVGNFAKFDFTASQFFNGGVPRNSVSDDLLFDIAKSSGLTGNIRLAVLDFEFTNTINRAYNISFNCYDIRNVVVYSFTVFVPASTGVPILIKPTPETFEKAKLDLFRTTHKVIFNVSMSPGIPLTSGSIGSLKMRSSATIYLSSK